MLNDYEEVKPACFISQKENILTLIYYNIAYIPQKNQDKFIQYARDLSKLASAGNYLLGECSIPHVSLCHFAMEACDINAAWGKACAIQYPKIRLIFNTVTTNSRANHPKWGHVSWTSLRPNHRKDLTDMHLAVASIIKTPLNASFLQYEPHLTLFNAFSDTACNLPNVEAAVVPPFEEDFVLALGLIDEVGQVVQVLDVVGL